MLIIILIKNIFYILTIITNKNLKKKIFYLLLFYYINFYIMPFTAYCDCNLDETFESSDESSKINIKKISICLIIICGVILATYYFNDGFSDFFNSHQPNYDSDSSSVNSTVTEKEPAFYVGNPRSFIRHPIGFVEIHREGELPTSSDIRASNLGELND